MTPALSYTNQKKRSTKETQAKEKSLTHLKVKEDTVPSAPRLALADDDDGHGLLPELRLALLHGREHHVAHTGVGETIQARTEAVGLDEVEVLRAAVVRAVDDGADGQTEGDAEFGAGGPGCVVGGMGGRRACTTTGRILGR